jgi:hypothetical protein
MVRPAVIAFLTLVISCPATLAAEPSAPEVPKVPEVIAVPTGHKPLFKFEARGVQIYKAVEREGKLAWDLEMPLAELFDGKTRAGCHYDLPPAWEAADGSKVVKSGDAKSAKAPADDDIPWLLVPVKAAEGKEGKFSPVVYIQRLQTEGGKPPAELPKRVGSKIGVPYKAVYYFYAKAD